jgi:ethanolamine-phosphate phospho-lyase
MQCRRCVGPIVCRLPEQVDGLRSKYMSNACSVSYKNTGPLHFSHGYKARLVDINGIEYLDTRNNVAHCGHGHPEIARAITYQVNMLQTNTRYLHPHASLLAKKLSDLLPGSLERVFFVNSGSEANDLALRLARAYRMQHSGQNGATSDERKDHTIVIDHGYHGHTLSTLDVSPYKHRQGKEIEKCPSHVRIVPCPDVYRGIHAVNRSLPQKTDESSHSKENHYCESEIEAANKYASYVELECEENPVSAFLIEGGMSVAGVILPPKSYLRRCIDAVHKAGGFYIADEVQTGFGRLGKCMWAFQYSSDNDGDICDEIIPDIVTVGKPFGNGQPLAAVVTTPRIASAFESLGVEYFNTFAGSPVACAAGLAMLHVLSSEHLQENANDVGSYLVGLISELQSRSQWIGDIRGSGLFIGVELVRDQHTLEPATEETSFVCSILKEKYKVLTSVDGAHENVIVIKPPLVFSREDAALFVSCFEKALLVDLPSMKDLVGNFGRTPT